MVHETMGVNGVDDPIYFSKYGIHQRSLLNPIGFSDPQRRGEDRTKASHCTLITFCGDG